MKIIHNLTRVAGMIGFVVNSSGADTRPNIIVIMSDDMGYSDIGCYGSEINTPNLDKLARDGIRMSQFYNNARCCPSRASLLTGLYPHNAGLGGMTGWEYPEHANKIGYQQSLNDQCVTIAQVLKSAGYRTYALGKWHVADDLWVKSGDRNWPLQRGFDRYYGTIDGAGSYYDPSALMRDNTLISPYNDPEYKPDGVFYYTDAISDNAVNFLREQSEKFPADPFFMYVAYTAAHWPMHALERDIQKYKGRYDKGYDAIRKERFSKLQAEGLISPDWELSDTVGDWDKVQNKEWEVRCMEVYAAIIDCMDQGIGRIVAELERTGQMENTLILFLEDNGGCAEGVGRPEEPGWKNWNIPGVTPMAKDALQRRILPPMQTRDGRSFRGGSDVMPGPDGTYIAYGKNWANVSDTPFRKYKHYTHEGGVSTPLIACWPLGINSPGRIVHDPAHLIDIMATCVDLSKAQYPEMYNGKSIHPMQGVSLRPVFEGGTLQDRTLFWEHERNCAVRAGRWKLVSTAGMKWELYDMEKDRTEEHDLAAQFQEQVSEMAAEWQRFAEDNHVLPWPWGMSNGYFSLKQDDQFRNLMSPDLTGKSFQITATGEFNPQTSGVVVSQGGRASGYTLFCENGLLIFGVRFSDTDYVQVKAPLGPDTHQIGAIWSEGKGMTLLINGQTAATRPLEKSLFKHNPLQGICCGLDADHPVGPYKVPYRFTGQIERVNLQEI